VKTEVAETKTCNIKKNNVSNTYDKMYNNDTVKKSKVKVKVTVKNVLILSFVSHLRLRSRIVE